MDSVRSILKCLNVPLVHKKEGQRTDNTRFRSIVLALFQRREQSCLFHNLDATAVKAFFLISCARLALWDKEHSRKISDQGKVKGSSSEEKYAEPTPSMHLKTKQHFEFYAGLERLAVKLNGCDVTRLQFANFSCSIVLYKMNAIALCCSYLL